MKTEATMPLQSYSCSCFFCEETAVTPDIYCSQSEVILAGFIGKKPICVDCIIQVYNLLSNVQDADDEEEGDGDIGMNFTEDEAFHG